MKTILIVITAILVFSFSVSAQTPSKPFSIYGYGGLTMVSGPQVFKDYHKLGMNFGAGIGFKAIPVIEIVLKGEYHPISKDWDYINESGISGGKIKIWAFGADARISSPSLVLPIKPFGFAGFGWAKLKQDDISIDPLIDLLPFPTGAFIDEQTKPYFNVGGGIEFGSGVKMFLQAKYMYIKTEGDDLKLIPVSFGVKF